MNGDRTKWKRMVVGLPQSPAEQAAVDVAAHLAEFLQIELLATFIADATLHTLAELSGARELRTLGQGWHAIDTAQIERDIARAASLARERFAETVGTRAVKASFDVIAGAELIASRIRADDIVAVIEPEHPGERITQQFTELLAAAFALAGAVLVVPRRIARTSGPIVALAAAAEDPCIRAALQIAAALKERLIVVTTADIRLPMEVLADAERLGVTVALIAGGLAADAWSQLPGLRLQERLRVLGRDALTDDVGALFASLQGIPLLVVDHGRPAGERAADENRQAGGSGA